MWIFIVVVSLLAVWSVAAAVVVALRDGYRAVPACDFEGTRKRT